MILSIRYQSLLLVFIFFNASWGQNDSIKMAQLLDSALFRSNERPYWEQKADAHLRQIRKKEVKLKLLGMQAKYFLRSGQFEKSEEVIQKGKRASKSELTALATFYSLEGSLLATKKEFTQSIKRYKKSLEIYENENNKLQAAYVKNNIANVFFNINDFESAYKFARESFKEVSKQKDTIYSPQIAAILSISEVKTGRTASAFKHAQFAVYAGKKYKSMSAIILGNYAFGDYYYQNGEYRKAISSYSLVVELAHQAQLFPFECFGHIGLLSAYNKVRDFGKAVEEGNVAVGLCKALKMNTTDYSLYNELSIAYAGIEDFKNAHHYLNLANRFYRENSNVENKKVIQELLTKYETEKKEKALSKKELQLTRVTLFVVLLVILLLSALFVFWIIRRRDKNKYLLLQLTNERKQNEAYIEGELRERQRLASEIHDGIASSLTALDLQINQMMNNEQVEKFGSIVTEIRNDVRLISRNIMPFNWKHEGWNASFNKYIESISTENCKVLFSSSVDESKIQSKQGMVLYRILQELVQNAIKHARSTECEVIMYEDDQELCVEVTDNGVGCDFAVLKAGNGWNSIVLRLESMNGRYSVHSATPSGLTVQLSFPQHIFVA